MEKSSYNMGMHDEVLDVELTLNKYLLNERFP